MGISETGEIKTPDIIDENQSDKLSDLNLTDKRENENLSDLDDNDISSYILELLQNNLNDRLRLGHKEKIEYDIKSYYGIKDEFMKNFPYPGASAFPVPLTPVLTDTAYANIVASLFSTGKKGQVVNVEGQSVEDNRIAKGALSKYINHVVNKESNFEREIDKTVFSTFLHGTGFNKIFFDIRTNTIKTLNINIENMIIPIDATGLEIEDTESIIQLVPLSWNDLQLRKNLGIYQYPDEIVAGVGIGNWEEQEVTKFMMDTVSGVDMAQKQKRDTYWIAECYLTYRPKNSSAYGGGRTRAGARSKEIIVWISPNGGRIQRKRLNVDGLRPYIDMHAYPYKDNRFYSMSLPNKIKNIQEEMDYADKQNVDALDRAIRPAAFVDDTSAFNPQVHQRVPGGIYPKGKANTIEFEPQPPVERGFERRIALLWEQAERMTGIIDITQGTEAATARTLGEVEIRTSRADVRFRSIYKRFRRAASKGIEKIYELSALYVDKNKVMRVIGYTDITKIGELFPKDENGKLVGNFDFSFSPLLLNEQEEENKKKLLFFTSSIGDPAVREDKGNVWRLLKLASDSLGIEHLESIIKKPKEADIYSIDEFLQRVMSGEVDIVLRPGIDVERYIFELTMFIKSDTFESLPANSQEFVKETLRKVYIMRNAERSALMNFNLIQQAQQGAGILNELKQRAGGGAGGITPPNVPTPPSPPSPETSPATTPLGAGTVQPNLTGAGVGAV